MPVYGDDVNDRFTRNTFQTGDAAFATEKDYGPVKFAALALDQAQRDVQYRQQQPVSNGRNYETYLYVDPWNADRKVVGLTVEDRVERRAAQVTDAITPILGAPTPLKALAGGYVQQLIAAAAILDIPPLKPA